MGVYVGNSGDIVAENMIYSVKLLIIFEGGNYRRFGHRGGSARWECSAGVHAGNSGDIAAENMIYSVKLLIIFEEGNYRRFGHRGGSVRWECSAGVLSGSACWKFRRHCCRVL